MDYRNPSVRMYMPAKDQNADQSVFSLGSALFARDAFTSQKYWYIPRRRWLRPDMTEKMFTGTLSRKRNENYLRVFIYWFLGKRASKTLLKNAKRVGKQGKQTVYMKQGGYQRAVDDFYSVKPTMVQNSKLPSHTFEKVSYSF